METRYIYDANGNLLAEADANNTITRYYVHGSGLLAAITPSDDLYCYHYDGVGNTVAITDGSQTIVNSYDYSPFGMILTESETFPQPFKFVGKLGVMAEGDFYYMRARYYDPVAGRFISEDPLGFDGGDVNLYVYGGNNPLLVVDPNGLWTFQVGFSFTSGGFVGSTRGGGLIIGRNSQTGDWQFGWYAVWRRIPGTQYVISKTVTNWLNQVDQFRGQFIYLPGPGGKQSVALRLRRRPPDNEPEKSPQHHYRHQCLQFTGPGDPPDRAPAERRQQDLQLLFFQRKRGQIYFLIANFLSFR